MRLTDRLLDRWFVGLPTPKTITILKPRRANVSRLNFEDAQRRAERVSGSRQLGELAGADARHARRRQLTRPQTRNAGYGHENALPCDADVRLTLGEIHSPLANTTMSDCTRLATGMQLASRNALSAFLDTRTWCQYEARAPKYIIVLDSNGIHVEH